MLAPVFRCVQDCDKDKGGRVPFNPFNSRDQRCRRSQACAPHPGTGSLQAFLLAWDFIPPSSPGIIAIRLALSVAGLLLSHKKAPCITIVAAHKHR